MARGKKNYFRHSFFARDDIKLRLLRDRIGVGFYFYYFSLLELCGTEAAEGIPDEFVFHQSVLNSLWGCKTKKTVHVAEQIAAVGLLFFSYEGKKLSFRIPNFSKYLGRYESKCTLNVPNKRKEKKIKEKKSENGSDPSDLAPDGPSVGSVKLSDALSEIRKGIPG